MNWRCTAVIALVVLTCGLSRDALAQDRIGVASVVKNEVSGTIAGNTQVIGVGAQVFQNEVVTTGPNSSAQLLLRDQTTLTIGADARVGLDRFVYDPQTRSGDIAINIAEGAFRFVSGNARSESYRINTPNASIGVRGTVVEGYVNSSTGQVVIVVVEGSIVVNTPSGPVTLEAGQYITVNSDGTYTGPSTWTGPTLDLDAGVQFAFDDQGNLLNPGQANKYSDFTDALDSRDVDIQFPLPSSTGSSPFVLLPPPCIKCTPP